MPIIAKAQTPEPAFSTVMRDGDFEIRDYGVMVIAQTSVSARGSGSAGNQGFRPLARYIFGGNQPRQKIAMTAPVIQQKGAQIGMTAPVIQQNAGGDTWNVRFVMPAGSRLATMPVPNDASVRLYEEPARRYAVLRFSGYVSDATFTRKSGELQAIMQQRRLTPRGTPILAQFDPPFKLPFMRRNEIWIEIARAS